MRITNTSGFYEQRERYFFYKIEAKGSSFLLFLFWFFIKFPRIPLLPSYSIRYGSSITSSHSESSSLCERQFYNSLNNYLSVGEYIYNDLYFWFLAFLNINSLYQLVKSFSISRDKFAASCLHFLYIYDILLALSDRVVSIIVVFWQNML